MQATFKIVFVGEGANEKLPQIHVGASRFPKINAFFRYRGSVMRSLNASTDKKVGGVARSNTDLVTTDSQLAENVQRDDDHFSCLLEKVRVPEEPAVLDLWAKFGDQFRQIGNRQIHRRGYFGSLDSDDVANETYYRLITRLSTQRLMWVYNKATFISAAILIANQVVRNAQQKEHHRAISATDIDHGAEMLVGFPSRDLQFYDLEVADWLTESLDRKQRQLIIYRLADNTIAETAALLGVSKSFVNRQLAKVRERLQVKCAYVNERHD